MKLEAVFHEKTVGYSSLTKYLRCARFGERDAVQTNSEDASDADLVNHAIVQTSAFQPFASVPQISRMIRRSKSTVQKHLIDSLGFILKRLR
jgi:hypothetical protein